MVKKMSFTIDEESLTIKGRKGDTASFTFEFENNLSGYALDFVIKKGINDNEPIITKSFSNLSTNSIAINLTSEDTVKFAVPSNTYGTYYWGLKISNGRDFVQTLIPEDLGNPPLFLVYNEVVG